mgnify:CR=1 FL=1
MPLQCDWTDIAVGENLKRIRLGRGISLARAANYLSTPEPQFELFEQGALRIASSDLFKLGRLLNVPVGSFFEFDLERGEANEMAS